MRKLDRTEVFTLILLTNISYISYEFARDALIYNLAYTSACFLWTCINTVFSDAFGSKYLLDDIQSELACSTFHRDLNIVNELNNCIFICMTPGISLNPVGWCKGYNFKESTSGMKFKFIAARQKKKKVSVEDTNSCIFSELKKHIYWYLKYVHQKYWFASMSQD